MIPSQFIILSRINAILLEIYSKMLTDNNLHRFLIHLFQLIILLSGEGGETAFISWRWQKITMKL
jgi:hypothetical protein